MSLITVDDVRGVLPKATINTTSLPTEAQVQEYIDLIESEVRALSAACFAPWPTDPFSVPGTFVRNTIMEGVKNRVLRAIFTFATGTQVPAEVVMSRQAYDEGIKHICDFAKALRENTPATSGGFVPVTGVYALAPGDTGTFAEYTMARNMVAANSGRLREGFPWPL